MPSGIILSSGSQGATKEDMEAVLRKNGYEVEEPEAAEPGKEAEPPEKVEDEEAPEPQHLTRRQKAVQRATAEMQRKLDKALGEIEELKKGKGKVEEPEPEPQGAPKREDFASDEDFQEALFDHRYQERRKKEAVLETEQAETKRLETNWNNYRANVTKFKEDHEDWDEVVGQPIPLQESVYLAIHEMENGPEVTYYLGKHPDYAKKLHAMSPLSALMEIGRLSERLKPTSGKRETDAARTSTRKIPDPVEPVSTAATSSTSTSKDAAAARDYKAFKRNQRAGR